MERAGVQGGYIQKAVNRVRSLEGQKVGWVVRAVGRVGGKGSV